MPLVDTKYAVWQTRLLDLSKRNRLLFFREFKRSSVRIVEPSADSIFQTLVQEERKLTFVQRTNAQASLDLSAGSATTKPELSPHVPPLRTGEIRTNITDESLEATLYNLRSRTRTALEEQGVHILFLAFGLLQWYETAQSNELIQTPLILVPVELERTSVTRPYTLELGDDDILLNPTLSYKLQTDFRLTLPPLPEDWSGALLADALQTLRATLETPPRWKITADVVLGLFSFEKLVMLKDLESHAATAKQHTLIMALAGDPSALPAEPSDLPRAEELDAKVKPEETFQVLDADSSQQEAVAQAKRGVSLVIQGPPGTGKSQTIANLIAEFLAQDKKVLFVSEKQAALDVVYQRLEALGLNEFCLKAHGHKANKVEILAQLERALQNHDAVRHVDVNGLRVINDIRVQLNAYVSALHTPITALQRTPYHAHGLLAQLHDAPDLQFVLNGVEAIDGTRLNTMLDAIQDLRVAAPAWQMYWEHPWRNTPVRASSFQLKSDVQAQLSQGTDAASKLLTTSAQLANLFGMTRPQSLREIDIFEKIVTHALASPQPLQDWFSADLQNLRAALTDAQQTYSSYAEQREKLFALVTPDILAFPDLGEMRRRFENNYRNFLRIFNSNYKRDLERVQSTLKTARKLHYGEARTLVELADTVNTLQKKIESQDAAWRNSLGRFFQRADTRWELVSQALEWMQNCRRLLGQLPVSPTFLEVVCHQPERLNGAKPLVEYLSSQRVRLAGALDSLKSFLPPEKLNFDGASAQQANLTSVQQRLTAQLDQVDRLEDWIHFETTRGQLDTLGLNSFVESVIASQPSPDELEYAFLKRFYRAWLDAVYLQKPILQTKSEQRARWISEFRTKDLDQLHLATVRVQAQLRARRPDPNLASARTSEVAILRKELQRRRHRPIRRVFTEIPNLLLTLTPCLMMSPLSVSMFLSGADFAFDAAIFDEASQVVPEDAIASIMRAKQIIVAGDTNQLPPTSFFKTLGIDVQETDEESGDEVLESILQECSFLRETYLKWHYRSRHESLIAFSNQHFYDNRLITFPSVVQSAPHLGIEFIHVPNGVYDRGKSRKNRVEAQRVAELVFEHFASYPEQSLGVVAFSDAQREAIDEDIQRRLREQPQFEEFVNKRGLDAFFVKNLENVQGDERDVMFFSVGYGKDANATLTLNFGPLNGENGARRLNVAITRARYHVKFISSILPEDINLANTTSRGVHLLRAYMEYARAGGSEIALRSSPTLDANAESDSPFEDAVYRALTNRGLTLHRQVGCSGYRIDLGVVDPEQTGRYLLGIECDGATYHSAKTARDRDRLRQQVLESLGWKIVRIWSRDWVTDPTAQIMRVFDALSNKPITPVTENSTPNELTKQFEIQVSETIPQTLAPNSNPTNNSLPNGAVLYKTVQLPRKGTASNFWSASNSTLSALILQLVTAEGPIAIESAYRRVVACWDMNRFTGAAQGRLTMATRELTAQRKLVVKDGFLWLASMTIPPVRVAINGDSPRPIEEIAVEEIAEAAYLCLQNEFSLSHDDLVTQTARLLGYSRTSDRIRRRVEYAIARLVQTNRARTRNEKIEAVK